MLLVGLTGGIGSGKSTVARMLEKRGAVVFDADVLARQAVAPGTPGFDRVVERFGPNVLAPGGDLDREALASIVFADPAARRDLEAIVHPEVRRMFTEGCEEYEGTDRVVVFSAPLLVETGMHPAFQSLLVVSTSMENQVERLMRERGWSEAAIRARIAGAGWRRAFGAWPRPSTASTSGPAGTACASCWRTRRAGARASAGPSRSSRRSWGR